jgi:hypothetical protein
LRSRRRFAAALCAAAVVTALGAAAAHSAGTATKFSGTTSQLSDRVSFSVARDGKALAGFYAAWDAHCDNGKTLSSYTRVRRVALSARRTFKVVGAYGADFPDASGYSARISGNVNGRLARNGKAVGALSMTATVSDSDGNRVTVCDTGRVTFSASRT